MIELKLDRCGESLIKEINSLESNITASAADRFSFGSNRGGVNGVIIKGPSAEEIIALFKEISIKNSGSWAKTMLPRLQNLLEVK